MRCNHSRKAVSAGDHISEREGFFGIKLAKTISMTRNALLLSEACRTGMLSQTCRRPPHDRIWKQLTNGSFLFVPRGNVCFIETRSGALLESLTRNLATLLSVAMYLSLSPPAEKSNQFQREAMDPRERRNPIPGGLMRVGRD
jgi:hypothetical protein